VHVSAYNKTQESFATSKYVDLEKETTDGKSAVVLVSVPKMVELKEAYPSYFLDTKDFLKVIDAIKRNCENYGYF
jgi:putative GTP pyrophosphokinase